MFSRWCQTLQGEWRSAPSLADQNVPAVLFLLPETDACPLSAAGQQQSQRTRLQMW